MAGLGAVAVPLVRPARPRAAQASTPLLPLRTPKIDHLDVIVPNVEASARFYMGVFNTTLHAQPFQGGFRYFVLFGDLPANRQVGYLAIGDSRGRGTYIGHFCTSVFDYRRDSAAITAALADATEKAGLGKLAGGGGIGGIFSDPDGIEIQFLPAPDTLVTAAVPSDLVPSRKGLVKPLGVDHVLLHVADLEKGVRFYRILYGAGSADRPDHRPRLVSDWRHAARAPAGRRGTETAHRALRHQGRAVRYAEGHGGAARARRPGHPVALRTRRRPADRPRRHQFRGRRRT